MEAMRTRNVRAMVMQQPPPHWMSPPPAPLLLNTPIQTRAAGFVAPLASSCAGCYADETGAAEFEMNKCGGCQLTRSVADYLCATAETDQGSQILQVSCCRRDIGLI